MLKQFGLSILAGLMLLPGFSAAPLAADEDIHLVVTVDRAALHKAADPNSPVVEQAQKGWILHSFEKPVISTDNSAWYRVWEIDSDGTGFWYVYRMYPAAGEEIFINARMVKPFTSNTLILHDRERDTSIELTEAEVQGFWHYHNPRFGFAVDIPDTFTKAVNLPDNGDGLIVATSDNKASLRVSGGYWLTAPDLEFSFTEAAAALPVDPAYAVHKENFWILSWIQNGNIHYRKFLSLGDKWCEAELIYPQSQKKAYDKPVTHVAQSLAFAAP